MARLPLRPIKPFLKWAGNKYRLLDRIETLWPASACSGRYFEPFMGAGAVFLNTMASKAILSDINADLISLYQQLQTQPDAVIEASRALFTPQNNAADFYYAYRTEFNTTTDRLQKAALFIYLNRHGFNGLCRYNSTGQFNVPFGKYDRPYFPHIELAQFVEAAQKATFYHRDFEFAFTHAKPGDWIYCDPPYFKLSRTAQFTAYAQSPFGPVQQERLAQCAKQAAKNGVSVILSNHNTPDARLLYQRADICIPINVQRFISCKGTKRNCASELLVGYLPAYQSLSDIV